ncbi:MAG: hypothetical protein KAR21_00440, partial [Spirochaetales bacterium]|nr:hypothetical protein [Spirochaetales bacterium]
KMFYNLFYTISTNLPIIILFSRKKILYFMSYRKNISKFHSPYFTPNPPSFKAKSKNSAISIIKKKRKNCANPEVLEQFALYVIIEVSSEQRKGFSYQTIR